MSSDMIMVSVLLLIFIAFKLPIWIGLGVSSMIYSLLNPTMYPLTVLVDQMITGLNEFTFLAIPFFIGAGRVMNESGVTEIVFDLAKSMVGNIRGGLGFVNILASMVFAGMSGASVADTAGLGLIEIKAMKDGGYSSEVAACITAASATIGPIIPPSTTMIIYGVIAHASIGRLFIGGIIPGIILGLLLIVIVAILARINPEAYPTSQSEFVLKDFLNNLKRALLPMFTPVIILGGIAFGVVTPTEAGVLAVLYSMLVGFLYRRLNLTKIKNVLIGTAIQTGQIMMVLAGARAFSYMMTLERVPAHVSDFITGFTESTLIFLLIVNITFLILGMFINGSTIIILTMPVLLPLLREFGVDVVHFGVVATLNVIIGNLTPPLGINLYIVSDIANIEFEAVAKSILVYYIPLIGGLLLLTYVPSLVTWLPELIMG